MLYSCNPPYPVVFTKAINNIGCLRCCWSVDAALSIPYRYCCVAHELRTFSVNVFDIHLPGVSPSSFMHSYRLYRHSHHFFCRISCYHSKVHPCLISFPLLHDVLILCLSRSLTRSRALPPSLSLSPPLSLSLSPSPLPLLYSFCVLLSSLLV